MKIAVILPINKSDYLANTVIDGLFDLKNDSSDLDFVFTQNFFGPLPLNKFELNDFDFIKYTNDADMIMLIWGKNSTNFELANKINKWEKTVFIDGSELGKNNRFDKDIKEQVYNLKYEGIGKIDKEMLNKCRLYFRREKPYIKGIIPFPFGIEKRYRAFHDKGVDKSIVRNIDFTCVFGQDEYPPLRRQAKEYLEKFCKENGFKCHTKKTKGFNFDDNSKKAGREDFYEILSRSKVGISIGGGGYDTARFWEILGSGAILFTEKIDIYNDNSRLNYKRIKEFSGLDDFKLKLRDLGEYIKNDYDKDKPIIDEEYDKVISEHSTKSRVKEIINLFNHAK